MIKYPYGILQRIASIIMKKLDLKFYAIKIVILLLINLFVFALSFILLKILGTLSLEGVDEATNHWLRCLIDAAISHVVYLVYIYKTTKEIKDRSRSVGSFVKRETAAYAVMMLIPTVCALLVGMEEVATFPISLFFLPNSLFLFAARNPVLGYLLAVMVYAATVWAGYRLNLKKHGISEVQEDNTNLAS